MKLFIVISVLYDDGSIKPIIEGVFKTKDEALNRLKKVHDEIVNDFSEPEEDNDFKEGDDWFEVVEGSYSDIYIQGSVKEFIADI